jgi:hypothetical protein
MPRNRNRRMLRSRHPEAPSALSAAFEVAAGVVCSKHGPRPGNVGDRAATCLFGSGHSDMSNERWPADLGFARQ